MWTGDWDDEVGNEDFVKQLRREYADASPAPASAKVDIVHRNLHVFSNYLSNLHTEKYKTP